MRAYWITDYDYALPTYVSISSFLAHNNVEVSVWYIGEKGIEEAGMAFSAISPRVSFEKAKMPPYTPAKVSGTIYNRLMRMEIVIQTEEDLVLLLDSDMIFTESSKELISILQATGKSPAPLPTVWGYAETPVAMQNHLYFRVFDQTGRDIILSDMQRSDCYSAVFGDTWRHILGGLGLNNGLVAFRNAQSLAIEWRKYYLKGLNESFVNPQDDQLPLAAAIQVNDSTLNLLDSRYNALGKVHGDYAVFHAYSGRWKMEYKLALRGEDALTNFAQIAQKHLTPAPLSWKQNLLEEEDRPCRFQAIEGFLTYKHFFYDILEGMEKGHCVLVEDNEKSAVFLKEVLDLSGKDIRLDLVGRTGMIASVQETYPPESLDFVFLDHDPSYTALSAEMERWFPLLKPGGVMAGMDYTAQDGLRFGRQCATYDFCERNGLSCRIDFDIFIIEK